MIDCRGGVTPPAVKMDQAFENAAAEIRASDCQALPSDAEMDMEGLGMVAVTALRFTEIWQW